MGNRGIEQGPGQLSADGVAYFEAAVGQHSPGGGRQPEQPGRRAAQQRGPAAQHAHFPVDLHGEAVRETIHGHRSIPSGPGAQLVMAASAASAITEEPPPLGGGGGGRVTQHPDGAHCGDTAGTHGGQQLRQGRRVS